MGDNSCRAVIFPTQSRCGGYQRSSW